MPRVDPALAGYGRPDDRLLRSFAPYLYGSMGQ